MAKRPTTRQIIARQERLERYQRATGKSNKEIARQYGITTKQVENFKRPANVQRKGWSHATASQKLFQSVGPPSGKGSSKVEGVRVIRAYTQVQREAPSVRNLNRQERDRIERSELVVQSYNIYRGPEAENEYQSKLEWAEWTEEHGLPVSWSDIEDMYENGEIDYDDYHEALDALREIYGKK